jgi:hypothetical protein
MNNKSHENNRTDPAAAGQPFESEPLMAVYNPQPPQPEQPARFYWQEPWRDSTDGAANDAVQAAFEN